MDVTLDCHNMTVEQALTKYVRAHNWACKDRRSITIIHGYGSSGTGGTIKKALRKFLNEYFDRIAEKLEMENYILNPGQTIVRPKHPIRQFELTDFLRHLRH